MIELIAKRRIVSTCMMLLCGDKHQWLLQNGSKQWTEPNYCRSHTTIDLSVALAVPDIIPLCLIRYYIWRHAGINEANESAVNMFVDIDGVPYGGNNFTNDSQNWHMRHKDNRHISGQIFYPIGSICESLSPETINKILEDLKSKHVMTAIYEILRRHFTK